MPTIVLTFTSGKDYLLEKLYFQNTIEYIHLRPKFYDKLSFINSKLILMTTAVYFK